MGISEFYTCLFPLQIIRQIATCKINLNLHIFYKLQRIATITVQINELCIISPEQIDIFSRIKRLTLLFIKRSAMISCHRHSKAIDNRRFVLFA